MLSMEKNKVWGLVELPEKEKQPITCKWIFKRKRDGKYKARLVARGFMQKEGVDYTETFFPVISMPSLRLVLVLILQENLHSYVMDVKTAFLNGDLDEVVYMSQPQGYDDGTRKVCKLNKSLLWSQTSSKTVVSQIPAVYKQSEIQTVYF
ncbi:Retrovirus-related Pol polyprotein from transposon TNT 1-94 [Araneus ventricosus]|uniref:Retrovirus-related Pol polyprotein from transposon TNT 1-94 n=1 Tax=Araneus ventricosus TaxID=182803 RepID=A0A4Y2V7D7_ARAVE|nr:Retrovirus-related Pol polyprotein from transposon TNT 1-94 [Araneus ventricosus]